jgi:putative membrane protein
MARKHRRIGRGLLAGLVGGLVASWTMNQFQTLWSKASERWQEKSKQQQEEQSQAESEDATMRAADKLIRNLLDHPLSKDQKKTVGPVVHYAFGSVMGAVYGVAAELFPEIATRGFGTGFGTALFAVADEIAVPALGLSGKPTEAPLSSHVYGPVSHYGATTEGVRRAAMGLSSYRAAVIEFRADTSRIRCSSTSEIR